MAAPASQAEIDGFVSGLLRRLLPHKRYILQALEVPWLPLVPLSWIDRRVLEPMRWAVAGTRHAALAALAGHNAWNLSGGYHHASRQNAEGFCIYNDVGMAVQRLRAEGVIVAGDRLLIVDVDAHHGNGNARVFLDDPDVTVLDIYNAQIYPDSPETKARVDIGIALSPGTTGAQYLERLDAGLRRLAPGHRLAFVVAGTDVLRSDPLGGLALSVEDCVARDVLVLDRLAALGVPAVFLGGGGYGPDSATAISASLRANAKR